MPFTFSHGCIVLPFFKNNRFSATALFVGTMAPDLEYFFRMRMKSEYSHTFAGIFLIDFPLALLLMFGFHLLIKVPLINNLPLFFQERLQDLKQLDWVSYFRNNFFKILYSFVLGALTHLFWDSMTHYNGYLVLAYRFFSIVKMGHPLYFYAQHFSSILGLVLIAIYFFKLPTKTVVYQKIDFSYWFWVLLVALINFIARSLLGFTNSNFLSVFVTVLVASLASFVFACAVVGAYWEFFKKTRL